MTLPSRLPLSPAPRPAGLSPARRAALGLVLNAVVPWNTRYIDAPVDRLRADGHPVRNEDVTRLSPLGHAHINMLGRYAFRPRTDRALRPLHDPDTVDE
jgi:hypothetical protein